MRYSTGMSALLPQDPSPVRVANNPLKPPRNGQPDLFVKQFIACSFIKGSGGSFNTQLKSASRLCSDDVRPYPKAPSAKLNFLRPFKPISSIPFGPDSPDKGIDFSYRAGDFPRGKSSLAARSSDTISICRYSG